MYPTRQEARITIGFRTKTSFPLGRVSVWKKWGYLASTLSVSTVGLWRWKPRLTVATARSRCCLTNAEEEYLTTPYTRPLHKILVSGAWSRLDLINVAAFLFTHKNQTHITSLLKDDAYFFFCCMLIVALVVVRRSLNIACQLEPTCKQRCASNDPCSFD